MPALLSAAIALIVVSNAAIPGIIFAKPAPDSAPHFSQNPNPCLYGWVEPFVPATSPAANPNGECKSASDCGPSDAWCVFSPLVERRICCRNRKNAVLPECPSKMLQKSNIGPITGPILCKLPIVGKKEAEDGEEECPHGLACVQSKTEFQKSFPGQPNTICCPQQ